MNNEDKILSVLEQVQANVEHMRTSQKQMQADISGLKRGQARLEEGQARIEEDVVSLIDLFIEKTFNENSRLLKEILEFYKRNT